MRERRVSMVVHSLRLAWTLEQRPRIGDHMWWISDLGEFQADYPQWRLEYDLRSVVSEIHDRNVERWMASA